MARLSGKVALVTGAANGIGRAIAERLLAEGARVAALHLEQSTMTATATERAERGGEIEPIAGDISRGEDVVRAIGDTRTLQARLLETTHGAEFFSLADQLGFVYSVDNVEDLELPAARQRRLSYVRTGTADQTRGGLGAEEGQP